MNNKNLFIVMIFFVVLFNSIAYSALNKEMFINGDAHIRVDKDIRITDVKVLEQVSGAYETYNSDYSKNTTSMQVNLPSSESIMVYEVTITNKGDTGYEVINIIEESYSNSNIKYELIDIESGEVIDGKTTHTFKIKFTTTENNSDNKTTLVLKYDFKEWIPSLYKMVAHKSRSLDTDIDFSVAPTEELSGVYEMNSTKDDEFPVYYYRGIIENNNVSFASFCWKIVRTTSTGGVKLIYNGVVGDDGSCNNTGEESQIGTSQFNPMPLPGSRDAINYILDNGSNSAIKTVIDNWYNSNIVSYTNMLEDTIWCSDRSIYQTSGTIWSYGSSGRNAANISPSITCPNTADKYSINSINGNGRLKYPIGLLTADEATLAGHGYKGYTTLGYLCNNQNFWLLSPNFSNTYYSDNMLISIEGKLINNCVREVYGVRPSVSLINTIMIKKGDGSVSNPYQLVENNS